MINFQTKHNRRREIGVYTKEESNWEFPWVPWDCHRNGNRLASHRQYAANVQGQRSKVKVTGSEVKITK